MLYVYEYHSNCVEMELAGIDNEYDLCINHIIDNNNNKNEKFKYRNRQF